MQDVASLLRRFEADDFCQTGIKQGLLNTLDSEVHQAKRSGGSAAGLGQPGQGAAVLGDSDYVELLETGSRAAGRLRWSATDIAMDEDSDDDISAMEELLDKHEHHIAGGVARFDLLRQLWQEAYKGRGKRGQGAVAPSIL